MTQDETLNRAIRLIKAGDRSAARDILDPFLVEHPYHIEAWMWAVELFPSDHDKMEVLQTCLQHNPDHPQALMALNYFEKRLESNPAPVVPATPAIFDEPYEPDEPAPRSREPEPVVPFAPPAPVVRPANPAPLRAAPVAPKKAPAPQRPAWLTLNLILAVVAFVVLIGLAGLYLGRGYSLNGQINQAFAGRDCPAVLGQASFASQYPSLLFASLFDGYRQVSECRLNLDIERFVSAKNWPAAFPITQQYLQNYPDGAFSGSLQQQAPVQLDNWSKELFARQEYASGIEKQKLIVSAYPQSAAAQTAPDLILGGYLAWADQLIDAQKYKEAEPALKDAAAYFHADAVRVGKLALAQVKLYVAWGDWQVQRGDITGAVANYQKAGEISPGGLDADLLVARAYLQKALGLSKARSFNEALAKVQEISNTAQSENIKAEAEVVRGTILAQYAVANSVQAQEQISTAIRLTCQGRRPELPIFAMDAGSIRFGMNNSFIKLPEDQVAARPAELHYVICITETEKTLETCAYTKGHHLTRTLYAWQITLYDMVDGAVEKKTTINGPSPKACPSVVNFMVGSPGSKMYGSRPTIEQIMTWLGKLKLAR